MIEHRIPSVTDATAAAVWLYDAAARDPLLHPLHAHLATLADGARPVLLIGEPGTGHERVARALHDLSGRAAEPFVVLDCGEGTGPTFDVQLLGLDIDGTPAKLGAFEQAAHGTVLLRAVEQLPPRLQEALEALLASREAALAAHAPTRHAARCIAATTVDLDAWAAAGRFRRDLLDRLGAARLVLPPLRARVAELPALARQVLEAAGLPHRLAPEAERALAAYAWPGNLPELRAALVEAAAQAPHDLIGAAALPARVVRREAAPTPLRDLEREHIVRALRDAAGRQRHAARLLGVSRWALARRMRKYGLGADPRSL